MSHVGRTCVPYDVSQLAEMPDWRIARVAAAQRRNGRRPGYNTRRIILWAMAYRIGSDQAAYRKFMRRYQMAWKAEQLERERRMGQILEACLAQRATSNASVLSIG